ncbi:glycosyltransferase [Phocaeicola plebeius]|mgnify:FL=1|uniref:glycosyltransferase family 2 protein n=1 Tax=Phocaeicola plebeius TaxID=310297 RepID=UPI0026DDBF1C|nr:glycosyltransferase [Phocaeicola plebeius]
MINFSVLLSVYYKESPLYLSQALCSIIKQSIPPTEIILVKDGELPKTLEKVISQFQEKNSTIKIVQLSYNQGLGKALNEGLKHCSYELIARMDTDDIAKPDRFEKQIKIFEKYPDIDICSAWIEEFENDTNNILSIKKLPEQHQEISKYARHRCPINHPVVMYKKQAVLEVGGYEGFPEDYRLWAKMLINGARFYNIQESLLYFRFSKNMIKRRGGFKYAIADIKSQIDFYKLGLFGISTLIYNILIRVIVRLTPNYIRSLIYKKILRR